MIEKYFCSMCGEQFFTKEQCISHQKNCISKKYFTVNCYGLLNDFIQNEKTICINKKVYNKSIECGNLMDLSSGYFINKDVVLNHIVVGSGKSCEIYTKDISKQMEKECIQKLIDWKLNQLNKEKQNIEHQILKYKNHKNFKIVNQETKC